LLSKNIKIKIYRTIILPVFLYKCETLSLTLREEQRSKVFVNRVLGIILGSERDEVTGKWRRLHNEKLYVLYFSPSIIQVIKSRIMGWMGYEACMEERRDAHRVLVGNLRERDNTEDLGVDGRIN